MGNAILQECGFNNRNPDELDAIEKQIRHKLNEFYIKQNNTVENEDQNNDEFQAKELPSQQQPLNFSDKEFDTRYLNEIMGKLSQGGQTPKNGCLSPLMMNRSPRTGRRTPRNGQLSPFANMSPRNDLSNNSPRTAGMSPRNTKQGLKKKVTIKSGFTTLVENVKQQNSDEKENNAESENKVQGSPLNLETKKQKQKKSQDISGKKINQQQIYNELFFAEEDIYENQLIEQKYKETSPIAFMNREFKQSVTLSMKKREQEAAQNAIIFEAAD